MRRLILVPLLVPALLGLGLHALFHAHTEACPGHLDGAHFRTIVHPEPPCPHCVLAGVAVPAMVLPILFAFLAYSLSLPLVLPPSNPVLASVSRAPPR